MGLSGSLAGRSQPQADQAPPAIHLISSSPDAGALQVDHSRKDIDILFYGWVLPGSHRDDMIKGLEARGLQIRVRICGRM